MLLDKLPWCSHGENLIFSIHVQQNGQRFATGGGDDAVKIWSLAAALDAKMEADESSPKLLSTMTDHTGPVNIIRFSPVSSTIATGSDDGTVIVYELQQGPGGGVLGGESNVENWRTKWLLRGHVSNIVDLNWSPDGLLLATASLDNHVIIWDMNTGKQVKSISHHTSFVKGVAWDPIGTYLATQSEDKSLIVWKRDDWSIAGEVKSPFTSMVSTTFAMRLSWSPDGQYVMAGNSYQGTTHAAVAIPRGKWESQDDYLLICGHKGTVVSACFSPKLFHVPPLGGGPPSESLSPMFALGAQDGKISVWAASAERAYFVGANLFESQVLDVAWTPDGQALFACSADKTVACLQFDTSELGPAATKDEIKELMKALYGSSGGRQTKRSLLESAEQLELEKAKSVHAEPHVKSTIQVLDARLGGGESGMTQTGFGPATTSPKPSSQNLMPMKKAKVVQAKENGVQEAEGAKSGEQMGKTVLPTGQLPLSHVSLPPLPEIPSFSISWQEESSIVEENIALSRDFTHGIEHFNQSKRTTLSVVNEVHQVAGHSFAQIKISSIDNTWYDLVEGKVVAAVGTYSFCAVATSHGHIIVYSQNGRRKCCPICIGSGISNLSSTSENAFLAVSTSGKVRVFDAIEMKELMEADLGPILEGKRAIIDITLSDTGNPLITMNDSSAYVWHHEMKSWMKVLDDSLIVSNFYPLAPTRGQGEVGALQSRARKDSRLDSAALLGRSTSTQAVRYHMSRNHLEGMLATAATLQSFDEFQTFLMSYSKFLVDNRDEARLSELADDLIAGQLTGDTNRERLLTRSVLLKAMASHRDLSGLLHRCEGILKDIEDSERRI